MSDPASSRRAIGLIVPSSNRVVERVAGRMLADDPGTDCCIARVPYGGIVGPGATPAYRFEAFDTAAALLADAGVDVICWNATRGAVLGFEADRDLCRRIEDRTGIPAVTTSLATLGHLLAEPDRKVGFLTQGDETEALAVLAAFHAQGVEVADHRWLGIVDNLDAARLDADTLLLHMRELAARSSLDTVVVWSTNLSGHAARLRAPTGAFTILDSAEIGIAAALSGVAGGSL